MPEEYWSITATLSKQKQVERFEAILISRLKDISSLAGEDGNGEGEEAAGEGLNGTDSGKGAKAKAEKGRIKITSQEESDTILAELQGATYSILKV